MQSFPPPPYLNGVAVVAAHGWAQKASLPRWGEKEDGVWGGGHGRDRPKNVVSEETDAGARREKEETLGGGE